MISSPRRRRLTILGLVLVVGLTCWWWALGRTGAHEPRAQPETKTAPLLPGAPLNLVAVPAATPEPAPPSFPAPAPSPQVQVPLGLHSQRGDTSTSIRFTNQTDLVVTVYWIDYAGKPVRYHVLDPDSSVSQQTYVSHPWIGIDEKGHQYQVTVADDRGTQEVVFGSARPKPPPEPVNF
jgi:VHL beta domain